MGHWAFRKLGAWTLMVVVLAVSAAEARRSVRRPAPARSHHRHRHAKPQRAAGPHVSALHPAARARLSAALREMRRRGVSPRLTSAYRSTAQQSRLFKCSHSRRCRRARGIYGARRPGTSAHEAGLAVDFAGIAARGRGRHRRLTGAGATIVRIMRRHDFNWRYGLRDPAHFELSPARVGYRSTRSAIVARQVQLAKRVVLAKRAASSKRLVAKRPPDRRGAASKVALRRAAPPVRVAKRPPPVRVSRLVVVRNGAPGPLARRGR